MIVVEQPFVVAVFVAVFVAFVAMPVVASAVVSSVVVPVVAEFVAVRLTMATSVEWHDLTVHFDYSPPFAVFVRLISTKSEESGC